MSFPHVAVVTYPACDLDVLELGDEGTVRVRQLVAGQKLGVVRLIEVVYLSQYAVQPDTRPPIIWFL